ncbi:MAG: hypothetical protein VX684_06195, partial [Planctomycetota bacterium]|nr:hypothetical protein [Planctomycetota bacterium]
EFTATAGSRYVIALGGFAISDYGPATVTITGSGPACPGDLDGDGIVNGLDLGTLLGFWNLPGADLDGDGTTSGADLAILLSAWGTCGG